MRKIILLVLIFVHSFAAWSQIEIGDEMPAITLKSSDNKDVNTSTFIGKFILIDFWASWCAPCRLGNKKLVKLHKETSQEKLEIIGISIDVDSNRWLKAIENDKIKFTQLIDNKGFDAKTAVLFGVEELPSKFLFDQEGKLIAKNPTADEITKLITKQDEKF